MDANRPSESSTLFSATLVVEADEQQKKEQDATSTTPVLLESVTQKRVLPTRSRRGGPGVGSSDIDLTILDAQRRAEENKPLIPPSTTFLLVTDASLVPSPVDFPNNANAKRTSHTLYQSYFDRPEVARAFRGQQIIETPIFTTIPSDAVGGRLRARTGDEEDNSDTSDGAYIARHRKYETFEKRQRRREKEKLLNEHQKLKARIEQLRAMDAAAFGGKDSEESEKRRRAMLATAEDLEARYRVLLPEPRHRTEKRVLAQAAASESDEEPPPQASKKLTIKISRPPILTRPQTSPLVPKSESARKKGRPPKTPSDVCSLGEFNENPSHHFTYTRRRSGERRSVSEKFNVEDPQVKDSEEQDAMFWEAALDEKQRRRRSESGAELDIIGNSEDQLAEDKSGESDGDPPSLSYQMDSPNLTIANLSGRGRRTKRMRLSMPKRLETPVPSTQLAMDANPSTCALLRQAARNDATTRKTKRAHEPLGAKLGSRVEEPSDYEVAMSNLLHTFQNEVKAASE